jgi:ubiquitin-conjugating enzyme E2 Q
MYSAIFIETKLMGYFFVSQKGGWNPVNDIESVIVSIRSLISVGNGRLEAAAKLDKTEYNELLDSAQKQQALNGIEDDCFNINNDNNDHIQNLIENDSEENADNKISSTNSAKETNDDNSCYTKDAATKSFQRISEFHEKKGWSEYWRKEG